MREIKFRGLDRGLNRFVYGMLMYSCSDSGLVIVDTINAPPTMQDPCGDTINIYHGIKQGTEGQYTGLKDKNGKEIYEGDIVKYKKSEQGKQDEYYFQTERISFNNGSFGFQEWYTDNDGNLKQKLIHHAAHHAAPGIYYIDFDLEIIGNIHENPELLKP